MAVKPTPSPTPRGTPRLELLFIGGTKVAVGELFVVVVVEGVAIEDMIVEDVAAGDVVAKDAVDTSKANNGTPPPRAQSHPAS
ncbi:hypothetical protein AA0113_g2798 [Alternaria arborescens]|uniref:Uncharacterized protein n=1 Tax=Alternaria arborescens TaxID=156630 RepID=A0A4Q4SKP1_9PLEO|nr:hypothetical protein AA0111_g8255 [Alternaria arborescens]RYO26380.1 hypothetical protein AA0111_g8255 [Alternaria arborescens]RYO70686.1 hypothetical protein AA0113_g2798 [Alternaria arborescens]